MNQALDTSYPRKEGAAWVRQQAESKSWRRQSLESCQQEAFQQLDINCSVSKGHLSTEHSINTLSFHCCFQCNYYGKFISCYRFQWAFQLLCSFHLEVFIRKSISKKLFMGLILYNVAFGN